MLSVQYNMYTSGPLCTFYTQAYVKILMIKLIELLELRKKWSGSNHYAS